MTPDDGLAAAVEGFSRTFGIGVTIEPGGNGAASLPPAGYVGPSDLLRPLADRLWLPEAALPEDLFPAARAACSHEGRDFCLPLRLDPPLLSYRSDLLDDRREQAGFRDLNGRDLVIPADWAQFALAAHHFTRPPQLYGAVFPGNSAGLSRFFQRVTLSLGGSLADRRGRPQLVTREAEGAGALIYDLLVRWQVAPSEILEMDEPAAADCFRRGRAAMAVTGQAGFRRTTDTSFSAVAGWFGLAPVPGARPPRRRTFPPVLSLGIAEGPQAGTVGILAGFLLMDEGQQALLTDGGVPARESAWSAEAGRLREGTLAARRWQLMRAALDEAPEPWPVLDGPAWTESLGGALRRMVAEQRDPRAALREAQEELEARWREGR
jgi:ABC-type glycerol-3-phosphate transport system substrate-binding protein